MPTVGFAYSKVSTDPINFEGRGVVQIDDFDSKIGFVGGTLTRTRVGGDGVSALTQFGTVTVYNDFLDLALPIRKRFPPAIVISLVCCRANLQLSSGNIFT